MKRQRLQSPTANGGRDPTTGRFVKGWKGGPVRSQRWESIRWTLRNRPGVAAVAIVIGNLLADLTVPLIDPRIRLR